MELIKLILIEGESMDNKRLVQKIEELSMNALPAIQTHIFDGWILRFSKGYTKRANSVNPIYFSNEELKRKVEKSEQLFREKKLRVVYKLTSVVYPGDLDSTLEKNGYIFDGVTSVQVLSLKEIEAPTENNVEVYKNLHDKWFSNFCILNSISENDQPTLKILLSNIIPKTCFILLTNSENAVIACGLGVLEDKYIGLFDIVTNEKYRNQGYGKQLILNILKWGKENGAENAYLQVEIKNTSALNLYSKRGFEEKYRYWYRIKE